MSNLLSLLACIGSINGSGIQFSLNDAVFVRIAAEVWEHTMNYTTIDGNINMLWASAFLLHLLDFYSISSDVLNLIITVYQQNLQEAGGETYTNASAFMADRGHRKQQAYVILLPSGLPSELRQTAPEHFLVVDSGATVHCLWTAICTAFLKEQNSAIN